MPDRFGRPSRKELRSQHLLRLGLVADRVCNGVPTDGFKMAMRICRGSGASFEDMAQVTPFTVDQLKEWSD